MCVVEKEKTLGEISGIGGEVLQGERKTQCNENYMESTRVTLVKTPSNEKGRAQSGTATFRKQARPQLQGLGQEVSHKNLQPTFYPACRMFLDQSLAELSSKTPDRFHPTADESKSSSTTNHQGSLVEQGQEGSEKSEGTGRPPEHGPQNQLTKTYELSQKSGSLHGFELAPLQVCYG